MEGVLITVKKAEKEEEEGVPQEGQEAERSLHETGTSRPSAM